VRFTHSLAAILLGLFAYWPLAAADAPSPEGRQELFDLSAQRNRLALEHELIDKRLAAIDKRLAELEKVEFAGFDRVADPTGTDYWESISDTVLFATAKQDISKGELLMYHAPGIYRVKDQKPRLSTKGECWYFRPDRDIKKGQRITIELVYDAPEEIEITAKGFFPMTDRARDPERPYNTKIRIGS
jgi:hypothetical protein